MPRGKQTVPEKEDGPTLAGQINLLDDLIKTKAEMFGNTPCRHSSTKDLGHRVVDECLVIDIKCDGCGLHWYYLLDGTLHGTWQLDLTQLRDALVRMKQGAKDA